MSDKSDVKALCVAADGNPNPGVAIYEFTPLSGKAEVQMRIRLAQTQKLIAVAEMNDGTLYTASREVKVTIGGRGGGAGERHVRTHQDRPSRTAQRPEGRGGQEQDAGAPAT